MPSQTGTGGRVRLGALKASITDIDGAEHVLAFPMKGDMLGSDGICHGKYMSDITEVAPLV